MLLTSPGTSKGQLLVDSDFNTSNTDAELRSSAGGGWYESSSDGTYGPYLLTLDTTTVVNNSSKKAKLAATYNNVIHNAYLTQAFSPAQTGTFSVQWDIYMDSITNLGGTNPDPDRGGWMLIGDNTDSTRTGPNSDDPERFVYMAFFKDGGGTSGTMDLVARDRNDEWDSFTTVTAGLLLKQWYTVKVVCNLTTDIYDVYVNGIFQQTLTSRITKTQVTHISFATWDDGSGTFYVDNVKVPIACQGDLDEEGDRDGTDLSMLIEAFDSMEGDANFDPLADLDGDNDVDLDDLTIFAGVFGQTCE